MSILDDIELPGLTSLFMPKSLIFELLALNTRSCFSESGLFGIKATYAERLLILGFLNQGLFHDCDELLRKFYENLLVSCLDFHSVFS